MLVGITLEDAFRAQELLVSAKRLASKGRLQLLDAVLAPKDADGHTHVRETIDPTPGRTAFSGAIWAGLFGLLLGGPVGWLAGTAVGAGAGVVTAKVIDLGIPRWVRVVRAAVRPGTATLALLVSDLDTEALVIEARRFTGARSTPTSTTPPSSASARRFGRRLLPSCTAGATAGTTRVPPPLRAGIGTGELDPPGWVS